MMDDRMGSMPDAMSGLPGLSMPEGPRVMDGRDPAAYIEEVPGTEMPVADDIPMQKKAKKKLVAKAKPVDDDAWIGVIMTSSFRNLRSSAAAVSLRSSHEGLSSADP